ncbi:MAG: adenylyltransferase/cytidyltransferase family protein [Acidobacteriota bacterium]
MFPGTFNPVTRAHVALAHAALASVDEVVFVLPRELPHKTFEGASFEDRVRMLEAALADEPTFSIAASRGGLFIEIARECREAYGAETELYFLCGRDAAERIVNWDYGREGAIEEQLSEYQLLVAPRQGCYEAPGRLRARVHALAGGYDNISASEVRRRIKSGEAWEELVPEGIVDLVRLIFKARF